MNKKTGKLFEQVKEQVIGIILEQGLKPHDLIPSEGELAAKFGVSRMTGKLALQALQDEGLVYRMPRRGTFLADVDRSQLEQAAGSTEGAYNQEELAAGRQIALIVPGMDDYIGRLVVSIDRAAHRQGIAIVLRIAGTEEEEMAAVEAFAARRDIMGILLFPVDRKICGDHLLRLKLQKYPVVILDRQFNEIDFDSVSHDHYQGSYNMTAHLLSLGHREIGFIAGQLHQVRSREERYQGYLDALLAGKVDIQQERILIREEPGILYEGDLERVKLIGDFLKRASGLTALVCCDDYLAMSAMNAALRLGYRVPEDLSVTGFSDHSMLEYAPVPMTTVAQPLDDFGAEALKLLLHRRQEPEAKAQSIRLQTNLVLRDSVSRPH
ncbi:substrate-binding domain-containing protein [Paenibacillus sp. JSM ZJ436]|uniref:substrate-binding domain-containing protein n=1 Tax=Paenibacillus sp. JSM ZJ436 TaxID=3376190 RepID=UPI0037B7E60D